VRAQYIFGKQLRHTSQWGFLSLLAVVLAGVCDAQIKPANDPTVIYERSHQSVVIIISADKDAKPIGQGSGFIVSKNRVVTNHHVIDGSAGVLVVFADGATSVVEGIAADSPTRDITILSVDTGTRPTLKFGDELSMRQGDAVYAVGAPRGLELSITNGIISGFRHIDEEFMIQNTAPIAPGSSGGPLFDGEGRVIGVTTSLLVDSPGIYFSIGVGDVRRLLRAPNVLLAPLQGRSAKNESVTSASVPSTKPTASLDDMNGTYRGTVRNSTAGISAKFSIFVRREGETIRGCMSVQRPLYGSGSLRGSVAGDGIVFTASSSTFQMTFHGTRRDERIAGNYKVTAPYPQVGEFELEKATADAPSASFDVNSCPVD
jgi:S1-C subfamily serine protease